MDYVLRFVAGGVIVSAFAILGDVLRPKSFAGLFGAAPSVALATLALAFSKESPGYVATEGRSMVLGAVALAAYSFVVCQALMRLRLSALPATLAAMLVWLAVAVSLEQLLTG
jgi:hypothetical protein